MAVEQIPRIDSNTDLQDKIKPFCRLGAGEVWEDQISGHRIGCLDVTNSNHIDKILDGEKMNLSLQDPPYNVVVGNENTTNLGKISLKEFVDWCQIWVQNIVNHLDEDASLYFWLGADQREGFQPLPDFMLLMREFEELTTRSFITMRNQRGYGTQKNWMAIRQELLYYTKGNPTFNIEAEYTDIPKVLKGYYKKVGEKMVENSERSKSDTIRAGNVWIDIQQVFYRMQENVPGCYAQKPLKSAERIISASSNKGDLVTDFFAHSGSTLIAAEKLGRKCYTFDIDPIFAEITIRRLEHFRKTGETGWQYKTPFPELGDLSEKKILHNNSTQTEKNLIEKENSLALF